MTGKRNGPPEATNTRDALPFPFVIAVRNLLDELRGGGQITGGPANFTAKDRQAFANQLDRWVTAK